MKDMAPGKSWLHSALAAAGVTVFFLVFPFRASAATLFLSPAAKTLTPGQTFTVIIRVSSADQAMNAVSADVSFPSDKVRVLSVSQTNSIVNFWVDKPSFSNAQDGGDVDLQGVVLSPGFTGASGDVVDIVFQAIAQGTAELSFSSGSVLANDGLGTNILTSMSGSSLTIVPAAAAPQPSVTPQENPAPQPAAISGIVISSVPSIVDDSWYALNNIQFNWDMPIGTDGVWYAFTTNQNMAPSITTVASQTTSVSYDLSSLSDGIWYFMVSSEEDGVWSPIVEKTLRLDRTPPAPFTITRTDTDPSDSQPAFTWATSDALSGLSHYEVKIGDGDWFDPETLQQGSLYILPTQSPTNGRSLAVRAIDNAGNIQEEDITFRVAAPNSWQEQWYRLIHFLSLFELLLVAAILVLVVVAYAFIYRLLTWRRRLRRELQEFKKELREEIERMNNEKNKEGSDIDLRPATLKKEKQFIEKEGERLKKDIETEVEKIKKLTGDK
jgi:hypothetical protein